MEEVLEKLTVAEPVKISPAFYRTRRFITVFKTTCHGNPVHTYI